MSPQLMIKLAISAFLYAGGLATGWYIQDYFITKKENEDAKQKLAAIQLAAAATIRNLDNVITAQNNAAARERKLRADASGSRDALISLSAAAEDALRTAETSHAACNIIANTQSQLFRSCSTEYQRVAEDADRAISERQTILDAWPK